VIALLLLAALATEPHGVIGVRATAGDGFRLYAGSLPGQQMVCAVEGLGRWEREDIVGRYSPEADIGWTQVRGIAERGWRLRGRGTLRVSITLFWDEPKVMPIEVFSQYGHFVRLRSIRLPDRPYRELRWWDAQCGDEALRRLARRGARLRRRVRGELVGLMASARVDDLAARLPPEVSDFDGRVYLDRRGPRQRIPFVEQMSACARRGECEGFVESMLAVERRPGWE
jgi:hypothetical protein